MLRCYSGLQRVVAGRGCGARLRGAVTGRGCEQGKMSGLEVARGKKLAGDVGCFAKRLTKRYAWHAAFWRRGGRAACFFRFVSFGEREERTTRVMF